MPTKSKKSVRSQSSSAPAKPKRKARAKPKAQLPSQKATTHRAKTDLSPSPATRLARIELQELSSSKGHRKLNLKRQLPGATGDKSRPQNRRALNEMSRAEKIHRTKTPERRIISGASINRKGRLNDNSP